jgi:transposase-like protein
MRPYSVDLRVRVVQAVNDDKKPPEEVAQQFRISPAFLTPHQHLLEAWVAAYTDSYNSTET